MNLQFHIDEDLDEDLTIPKSTYSDIMSIIKLLETHLPQCDFLQSILPKLKEYIINIILVSNNRIKELNKEYCKKDTVTDVLTFFYADINLQKKGEKYAILDYTILDTLPIFAETYIAYGVTIEQARQYQHSFMTELFHLIIHSLFHAFGLDHENSDEEYRFMQTQEFFLWNTIKSCF